MELITSRIIKGDVERGFAQVCAISDSQSIQDSFCSGTLVGQDIVISAAHCLMGQGTSISTKDMYAVFESGGSTHAFKIVKAYIPQINVGRNTHQTTKTLPGTFDVCVFFLETNVPATVAVPSIIDVSLPSPDGRKQGLAKIIGFGLVKTEYDVFQELRPDPRYSNVTDDELLDIARRKNLSSSVVAKRSGEVQWFKLQNQGLIECIPNNREQITYSGDSGGPVFSKEGGLLASTSFGTARQVSGAYYKLVVSYSCPLKYTLPFIKSAVEKEGLSFSEEIQLNTDASPEQIVQDSIEGLGRYSNNSTETLKRLTEAVKVVDKQARRRIMPQKQEPIIPDEVPITTDEDLIISEQDATVEIAPPATQEAEIVERQASLSSAKTSNKKLVFYTASVLALCVGALLIYRKNRE